MQIFFLIAGLILLIAGGSWFAGAAAVGWICLAVFAAITGVQIAVLVAAWKAQKSFHDDFDTLWK